MRITELIGAAPAAAAITAGAGTSRGLADIDITGLTADSRQVQPGYLFAALRGLHADGRRFAAEAVARGAAAILTDEAAALDLPTAAAASVAIVVDANPHRRLAQLAARFHRRQPSVVAAVTGTNGKTSVAHFTRELWAALGRPAASLGTLGLVTPQGRVAGSLTTPDPVALHRDLAGLAAAGIEHVAIEASSHGLVQYRLDGLVFAAAAFTNLTRDHLDYHGDLAAYRAAKFRLFDALLPADGTAVLNADSAEFAALAELCRGRGQRVLAYGAAADAALRLVHRTPQAGGQHLALDVLGAQYQLLLPLAGDFQVMNALAALGLVLATGAAPAPAVAALARLTGVPGRIEQVATLPGGAAVYVDFAHTPDALVTVLTALRPHAAGRLAVVFGAGGDRDAGKRPLMGAAATRFADRVYVTDDNPRSEAPNAIRRAILAAAPGAVEIGDRRAAIAAAIADLRTGDVLVVAGKGHETGQTIGAVTHPFDDAEIVRTLTAGLASRVAS